MSRRLSTAAVLAACAALCGAAAPSAGASIYIGGNGPNIQQAPTAGGKATTLTSARGGPEAVVATASSVYWTNNSGNGNVNQINRVNAAGRGFKANIVPSASFAGPLAVTSSRLYFGWQSMIGSSTLGGTSPDLDLVNPGGAVESLAISNGELFWTTAGGTSIGRSNLDGSSANANFMANVPGGVNDIAVSGDGIYWSNDQGTAIGKADLSGANINQNFITGMAQVGEVDILGEYLYWTNTGGQIGPCDGPSCMPSTPGPTAGSIDRASLDGTGGTSIVKGLNNPVTLDVLADAKSKSKSKKPKRRR